MRPTRQSENKREETVSSLYSYARIMRPGGRLQPAEGFVPLSAVSADYELVGINLDDRIMVVRSLDHALKDEMQNGAETVGAPFVMMACKERPDARVSLQQGGDLPMWR